MEMKEKVKSNIKIEGAILIRKNFSGRETDYNDKGNRNFGVILDEELADVLFQDGWNVKRLKPSPDFPDQPGRPWLPVKVKFGKIPPVIVLITSRGKIKLDEDTVSQLDWTRATNVDLIIHPYNYPEVRGRAGGVAAYLRSMYVTVDESEDLDAELAAKYGELPFV